jgi:hypothetical protein
MMLSLRHVELAVVCRDTAAIGQYAWAGAQILYIVAADSFSA